VGISESVPKLRRNFHTRKDVLTISKELIGQILVTHINGELTTGRIVETEAYAGMTDRASHAFGGRRTPRTDVMYAQGGTSYVYLCYGIHHLFNVVTHQVDTPHAILIRAVEPIEGIDTMLKRRRMSRPEYRLTAGPGSLALAMGITTQHSGVDLLADDIYICSDPHRKAPKTIIASPRVGVSYAKEDSLLPWRFRLADSPWTSPAR
jgi:DNA-3-methyladenine glycosylase